MAFFDFLRRNRSLDRARSADRKAVQEITSTALRVNPLCSNYENLFAQVRPLINAMKVVEPYGVGKSGGRLPASRTPELTALQTPNDQMGYAEFIDLCLATWLTEKELNVHVWKTPSGAVYGYSVLPPNSRHKKSDGESYFQVYAQNSDEKLIPNDEVMTLRFSRSPRNPDLGVSPATSVSGYAQLDDLVAQYQKAYFENGAIPASITFITASTYDKYYAKRRELERGLSGAGNRNKTIYAWRQMLDDGTTGDQLEVKTIQGDNSTLALQEIVDIVNDRLNKSVGVSNFLLGDDSSAKYDNAELSDHIFTKLRVYPALVSFWGQFQFELDRIVGGLGYAISFDLEIPELTERKKSEVEIRQTEASIENSKAQMMTSLISAGAPAEAAVAALDLPVRWLGVARGIEAQAANEKSATGDTPIDHALEASGDLPVKTKSGLSEVTADSAPREVVEPYLPEFKPEEKTERAIYEELIRLGGEIASDNPGYSLDEIVETIVDLLKEKAEEGQATSVAAIVTIVAGRDAALAEKIESDDYAVDEYNLVNSFKKQVYDVLENFVERIKDNIKRIREENQGKSAAEIKARLIAEGFSRKYAEIIARNETAFALESGRYDADRKIANRNGLTLEREWFTHLDEKTCEVCRAMNGKREPLHKAFDDYAISKDGVQLVWEHNVHNLEGLLPHAHVNCRCDYKIHVVGLEG